MCDVVTKNFGRVYVSLSRCIYQNLAFEEFLFRSHDVSNGDIMLIWKNRPAVVVGRHQNPWVEVNMPYIRKYGIDLARRHSGGGTVYHDLGNLNVSILTSHKDHCRPRNLTFLADGLNKNFRLNIIPNKRDDMELQPGNRKCSGTAARISRGKAYHHLTLLIQADLERLRRSLSSPYKTNITSNATASVRAPSVGFLKQDNPDINVESVEKCLVESFQSRFKTSSVELVDIESKMMDNEELVLNYQQLREWDWVFGKTPKFSYISNGKSQVVEKGFLVESGQRFSLV